MQHYSHLTQKLQQAIKDEQLLFNHSTPKNMYEPMAYIVGLGGKRVRPLLTLVGCELFDRNSDSAIPSAMAVELFHNFSLIHDDILDNAPLRRGEITVHEKWNTNIAILSGDGMFAKAVEIITKSKATHIPSLVALFSKTAIEVCEGQQYDMDFETQQIVSVDEYIHMITYKTAVLLGCSLQMGAICAEANTEEQNHIYEFGKHVGIAFQILDDVLDVYADDEKFGKQVGGDIISNKKTFLLLNALALSNDLQKSQLLKLMSDNSVSPYDKVKQVTAIYDQLNIKTLSINEANKHTDIALSHLEKINASEIKKQHLKEFSLYLLNREN